MFFTIALIFYASFTLMISSYTLIPLKNTQCATWKKSQLILQLKVQFCSFEIFTNRCNQSVQLLEQTRFYEISALLIYQSISSLLFWNIDVQTPIWRVMWPLYMAKVPFRCVILNQTATSEVQKQRTYSIVIENL